MTRRRLSGGRDAQEAARSRAMRNAGEIIEEEATTRERIAIAVE